MNKAILSFFIGLTYLGRGLKQPATWGVIFVVAGLWFWSRQRKEAAKVVNKVPPIEFKALVHTPPATDASTAPASANPAAVAFSPELAVNADGSPVDPEKLPVMSSRDLEVAVGRFHKDNLRLPKDADELIEQKYLVGVPPAPPGKHYVLDLAPIQMRLVSRK